MTWQHEVRSSWKIAAMQPEAIPEAVDDAADDHFRLRVSAADCGHVSAALLLVMNVCHQEILRRTSLMNSSIVNIVIGRSGGYSF